VSEGLGAPVSGQAGAACEASKKQKNYLKLGLSFGIIYRAMPEEKEVSDIFLKTVDEFYKESDVIFDEFDAILESYKKGGDITGALREFQLNRASIFSLIDAFFHKTVEFEDKLEKAGLAKKKVERIREFKKRFADLADEIDLYVIKEIGVGRW
jgi:hypothetical protein